MRAVSVAALLAAITIAPALRAQRARGFVRDSVSQQPLSGAVISVVDSAGVTGARTIADGAGRFSVPLMARASLLHVIRIGYRPHDVVLRGPAADTVISFGMVRVSTLDAVQVAASELCPGSTDRGAAFQLWEQARAGLLASVVARETRPAEMTTLTFRRALWPSDNLVYEEKDRILATRTARPFMATAPPSTFAARGYMTDDPDGGRTYNAPDADVLLDESFVATHCFHLQSADDTHRDQIGLAFSPMRGRDTLVDVSGVIWLDRATPALRTLEFRFTGLEPAAERANTGGHLEFRTMPNGITFIEYWVLRLPDLTQLPVNVSSAAAPMIRRSPETTRRRRDRIDYRVVDIREAGGQVLNATWDDGARYESPRTVLAGTVTQRGTHAPVPFAVVSLVGTSLSTVADATGTFALTPMIAGRYSVATSDTTLAGFTPERSETKTVEVLRDRVTTIHAELSTLGSVLANVCKGQPPTPNTGTIVGHASLADGAPWAKGTQIFATWLADVTQAGSGGSLTAKNAVQSSTLDAAGRFVVCGVAIDRPVRLKLPIGQGVAADTTLFLRDTMLTRVDWRVIARP